ncbi:P-loop containing nucleoside triphosphate hydrolase protein [Dichotomocladium elegans]|nr:P-loop containing nucleoside triphosphate hydrolase protein [Dichotomocladium elegans]
MPVSSTLLRATNNIADVILTFLDQITDEKFWESLLGQRLVELCKRYFGNDFVILSLVYYVSSLLQTKWTSLVEYILEKLQKPEPKVVTIQLITHDKAYVAVDDFVRSKIRRIPNLTHVFATYEEQSANDDNNNDDNDQESKKPVVQFYPPEERANEITYKGHTLSVTWKSIRKPKEDEDNVVEGLMFRGRFVSRTLEISMVADSLDLLKQFIQEWTDIYNDRQTEEVNVHKYTGTYTMWEHYKTMDPRPLSTVALKAGLKDKIVNDMERFRRRKRWYKTRGVPYRRGYLLYGPPGTGKTSLIQALAAHIRMDIGIVSLLDIYSDSEFSDMLNNAPANSMIVLEDFDHYIHKVADSTERGGVSIAGVLNALDGIQGQSGSMIFMSCNDITKLPPALLRPGRMDVKLKLDYADRGQIQDMFWQFFGHDPDTLEPLAEGELKTALQQKMKEFANHLPEDYVTTAELENYFITLWMEADIDNPDSGFYQRIFDGIPEFLRKVKLDRKQAEEHEARERNKKLRKKKESDNADWSDDTCSDEKDPAPSQVEDKAEDATKCDSSASDSTVSAE